MRRALILIILGLLLVGARDMEAQVSPLTGTEPIESLTWAQMEHGAEMDSTWWRSVQIVVNASPDQPDPDLQDNPAPQRSVIIEQLGPENVVLGRPDPLEDLPTGLARILQVGRENAAGPLAQIGRESYADISQRGTSLTVGLLLQRGERSLLGWQNAVVIRQEGFDHLVWRMRQRGRFNRIGLQQRGRSNAADVQQTGVDSTAQVVQEGWGNEATVRQGRASM